MKFERLPSIAETDFLPVQIKPRHRLQLVPLADDLVAAFYDAPAGEAEVATSLLAAWAGDEALCRPLLGSRLVRRDGGVRYVFFIARSSRDLCRRGLWLSCDDKPVAEIDPTALQSPVVDALALVVGLAPEGEQRLLRALLTTGQSLFGDRAFGGIRDLALQLLERLAPPPLALRAWCPLGKAGAILSYTLPRDLATGEIGTLVAIGDENARLSTDAQADVETLGGERLLHLFLPCGVAPGTLLVALSETPLRLAGPTRTQRQRPLGPWLTRRSPQIRQRTRKRLDALALRDATVAALVAEVSCPEAALPDVTTHLVSSTTGGIFFAVGVRDPRRLLARLILRTADADITLPLSSPRHHPRHGPLQLGFVPISAAPAGESLPGGCAPGDGAEVFALYRSGRMSRIGDVTLTPFPMEMPALFEDLPARDVAPSLGAALADALRSRPQASGEVIAVAAPEATAQVTLVLELGASLDYPYALAAALAGRRDVVLMLHHPDRRTLAALRALGEELHEIYGIGVDLFDIAEEDLLPAERSRAALAAVGTDAAIVLSADALPQQATWLEPWLARLSRPEPVLASVAVCGQESCGQESCGQAIGGQAIGGQAIGGRETGPGDQRTGTGAGMAGPGAESGADLAADSGADFGDPLDAQAFGLNAAARAVLSQRPLRAGGRAADLADLAATLRRTAGAQVVHDPLIRMVAHSRLQDRPAALTLAERLILEGTLPA